MASWPWELMWEPWHYDGIISTIKDQALAGPGTPAMLRWMLDPADFQNDFSNF